MEILDEIFEPDEYQQEIITMITISEVKIIWMLLTDMTSERSEAMASKPIMKEMHQLQDKGAWTPIKHEKSV